MKSRRVAFILFLIGFALLLQGARQRVTDDRELKEIDLKSWDCVDKLEGSAKTPEQMERNRLKNRSAPEGGIPAVESTDVPGFLRRVTEFEAQTKNRKRVEINMSQKDLLAPLEKKLVSLTGYLNLAYPGPPETTNCGSSDFHDWHLEVFEKPMDHSPAPGDTTPIICEITPRTQNAIYHDGIRIQELAAFFRGPPPEMAYESTGHKAQKIRVTGYLLWDDEHNGTADIGTTIEAVGANKLHHPWRQAAWEIHPVLKIERADASGKFSRLRHHPRLFGEPGGGGRSRRIGCIATNTGRHALAHSVHNADRRW